MNDTNSSYSGQCRDEPAYEIIIQKIITWCVPFTAVASILVNCCYLTVLVRTRRLRTVFNLYLIYLSGTNIVYTLISMVGFSILFFIGHWPLGIDLCVLYKYSEWVFSGLIVHIILLIGIDRLWALYFPFHYRLNKSERFTHAAFMFIVLYLHVINLPILIMTRIELEDARECEVVIKSEFQRKWTTFINFIAFIIPHILLYVFFPLIAQRLRQRARVTAHRMDECIAAMNLAQESNIRAIGPADSEVQPGIPKNLYATVIHREERERRLARLYALLAISLTVISVPSDVFYIALNFYPDTYNKTAYMVITYMMFLASVTNPIFYQYGDKEFTRSLRRLFFCQ